MIQISCVHTLPHTRRPPRFTRRTHGAPALARALPCAGDLLLATAPPLLRDLLAVALRRVIRATSLPLLRIPRAASHLLRATARALPLPLPYPRAACFPPCQFRILVQPVLFRLLIHPDYAAAAHARPYARTLPLLEEGVLRRPTLPSLLPILLLLRPTVLHLQPILLPHQLTVLLRQPTLLHQIPSRLPILLLRQPTVLRHQLSVLRHQLTVLRHQPTVLRHQLTVPHHLSMLLHRQPTLLVRHPTLPRHQLFCLATTTTTQNSTPSANYVRSTKSSNYKN